MVFDIIPIVPSAIGTTTVNAAQYDVDCAALPHANNTQVYNMQEELTLKQTTSPFYIDDAVTATIPLPCKH